MPFSTLSPEDIAWTKAALDAAWNEIKSCVPARFEEEERTRLAFLITSFLAVAEDEQDLARRAIERYRIRPQIPARNPRKVGELRSRNSR